MSEKSTTVEKRQNNFKKYVRNAGALAGMAAAFAGATAHTAHAERHPYRPPAKEARHKGLRSPAELPGIKIHLGQETLNEIKGSTLEIVARLKPEFGGSGNWTPSCTAVKVSIPGQAEPEIMTAAHCFYSQTGVRSGAFANPNAPKDLAENYTSTGPYEYAIADPTAGLEDRMADPVAFVDKISISTEQKDVAMLHSVPTGMAPARPGVRSFDSIPSIPLKVAEKAPLQGTPVALYGEPQADNFEAIAGTGTYLGRVYLSELSDPTNSASPIIYRQIDLVGINPQTPEQDNCNYGTSGSMALLPDGRLLGNLTIRVNRGYGPDRKVQAPDNPAFDNYWRPIWEKQLNVKLDGFSTICGYTVMDTATPANLLHGFDVLPPGATAPAIPLKP